MPQCLLVPKTEPSSHPEDWRRLWEAGEGRARDKGAPGARLVEQSGGAGHLPAQVCHALRHLLGCRSWMGSPGRPPLMASTVARNAWPSAVPAAPACARRGQRLPGGPGYPNEHQAVAATAPACRGAQSAGAALPGCWTSGPPRPPTVLVSGPALPSVESAGAVDLQWAEPVAPRGQGLLRREEGSAGLLGQCHFVLISFLLPSLCSSCLPFSLSSTPFALCLLLSDNLDSLSE